MWMRCMEYSVLEDPCPQPRNPFQYFLTALRDTFAPHDDSGVVKIHDQHAAKKSDDGPGSSLNRSRPAREDLLRQPLAASGVSYLAAVLRLLAELAVQYGVYDLLLTLCVKRSELPPLLSLAAIPPSLAMSAVLYLHFAIHYKGILLLLSLARPQLLRTCRHQFREPWLGLFSVSELWQRWHQLFRTSFTRLAHRPARALVRRLLTGSSPRPGGSGGSVEVTAVAGGAGPSARPAVVAQARRAKAAADAAGLMAVFLLSGMVHEYMCWAAFGRAKGYQLAFFLAHGAAVLAEQAFMGPTAAAAASAASSSASATSPSASAAASAASSSQEGGSSGRGKVAKAGAWRRPACAVACALFCAFSSVLFMRPWLEAGWHEDFWHPVSPTAWVLRRAEGYGNWAAVPVS
ncbi:hypothetical protein HYH03_000843 [Edaphochlamys debaryana]|uniref:Wax synthase domain-containing protein n=1 Tax=Edaphochlamys debaryana TaxID=47281 RepID=A0A835YGZ2_9CHLO|nr:hypothetical protein HYH03_000843 [Edaphochlamys debaryana]|eukprot:KAG2501023.1 hypothetical protein HYH03_000843 [Edaphochlamys debaryana]